MLGINSLFGKPLIPQPQCNETEWNECFTCVVDPCPFSAGCEINLSCKAGLLTYSGYDAFPVFTSGLKIVVISCVRCRTGTYSSGNCCRLSRHSLLIGGGLKNLFRTFARQRYEKIAWKHKATNYKLFAAFWNYLFIFVGIWPSASAFPAAGA